jgi:excisionase family DNA binding protein
MEQVYTVQEVSNLLKVGYRTVLDQINLGRLEAYQISNRYRISESAVHRYLSANKVKRVAV